MRILITGGAGFIGSHIASAYVHDGHEVAVLDNFRTGSKRNLPAGAALFAGDISQAADVEAAFRQFRPEVVSHYAAQLDVRYSLEDHSDLRVGAEIENTIMERPRESRTLCCRSLTRRSSGRTASFLGSLVPPLCNRWPKVPGETIALV